MRRLFKFLLLLLFLPSLFVFAQSRPLKILSHDRPPFHFADSQGNVVGICVDIIDIIFDEMGLEYEVIDLKWARVWYKVENGEGEAAFSTSRKKPREPYLYYPETDMWRSDFVFFVQSVNRHLTPNGSYEEVAGSGGKVGVWRGASYDDAFWKTFPYKDGTTTYSPNLKKYDMYNEQLFIVKGPSHALKMLGRERVSFFLEDRIAGQYLVNKNNLQASVVPYEQSVFSKGYPMPFIKNSDYPELKQISEEFERRLIILKNDGRYEAILKRWLNE